MQADPLTYLRTVELLAEGSGSVGWNLCNNNIAQLVTLGLPDGGIREIYGPGGDVAVAGTAVQGGGRAVPSTVATGSPVAGHSAPGARRAPGCWAASRSSMATSRAGVRMAPPSTGAASSIAPKRRSSREAGMCPGSVRPAASTGRSTTSFCRSGERWSTPVSTRQPVEPLAGSLVRAAGAGLGRATSQRRDHRHRPGRHRRADRAGRREDATRPDQSSLRQPASAGRDRPGRRDPERGPRVSQRDDHGAVEYDRGRRRHNAGAARPVPAGRRPQPPTAPARRWTWCTGRVAARPTGARAVWPSCWRDLQVVGQAGHHHAGVVPDGRPWSS